MSTRWGKLSVSSTEAYLSAHGCTVTLIVLYGSINCLLFCWAAKTAISRNTGYRRFLLPIARGCAQIANLNIAAVLTFASRSLSSSLRETPASLVLPLDKLMPRYHSFAGRVAILAGFVHAFIQSILYGLSSRWTLGFRGTISLLATGIGLVAAMAAVGLTALKSVRIRKFEIFYGIHVFGSALTCALIVLHGLHHGAMNSWKWVIAPLLLYALDIVTRKIRVKRSYLLVSKHDAGFHASNVLKIRLPRLFHFAAGQYAELKVPRISRWQWHPFTIASAPHEDEMVFYVKVAGNWTRELYNAFCETDQQSLASDIEIHVRGPFGAPAQHVGEYDHVILIGGGVGATPFCSVAKNAQYLIENWRPLAMQREEVLRQFSVPLEREPQEISANTSWAHSCPGISENGDLNRAAQFFDARSDLSKDIYSGHWRLCPGLPNVNGNGQASSASTTSETETMYTALEFIPEGAIRRDRRIIDPSKVDSECRGTQSHMDEFVTAGPMSSNIGDEYRRLTTRRYGTSVQFSRSVDTIPQNCTNTFGNMSITSRGHTLEYMQALYSVYTAREISETYNKSLNMLVGMNFGSLSIVKNAQFRMAFDESVRRSSLGRRTETVKGLSVFQNPFVMFLLFMRSVTIVLIILWLLICRIVVLAIAAILQDLSVLRPGLGLYSNAVLSIVDLTIAGSVFVMLGVPVILEVVKVRVLGRYGLEGAIAALLILCDIVFVVLSVIGVGRDIPAVSAVRVFAVWPTVTFIAISRLVRVIRERISNGGKKSTLRDIFTTKSLEFYWTSPRAADDEWLVHELRGCKNSSVLQLHRYLTRESNELVLNDANNVCETRFGRPDWDEIFNDAALEAKNGTVIGVFFCGPEAMSAQVQKAATKAMRNSIVRGLQAGAYGQTMRELEAVFGEAVSANEHTGEEGIGSAGLRRGCNIRFVYRKEYFS